MDVTRDDHVQHALDYIQDNLPAGEQGMQSNVITVYFLIKRQYGRYKG